MYRISLNHSKRSKLDGFKCKVILYIYSTITMGQHSIYSNEKRQQQHWQGAHKTANEGDGK